MRRKLSVCRDCVLLLGIAVLGACSGGSPSSNNIFSPPPPPPPPPPAGTLAQISSDPFTVGPGQHATEVEPHLFAFGSTLVAAFQTGRIAAGGSTDIGWATSTDGGTTWSHGFLPGLTTGEGTGPYDAASDPVVAYDAKHSVWMISTLPLSATLHTPAVGISRSTDGGFTWQPPISVDTTAASSDKNWIVCDNWPNSPHFGNCYSQWDDPANGNLILMSTSSDGGITWGPATSATGSVSGIGGQPLVQPNGNVIVPLETNTMSSFTSTDGGVTWGAAVSISNIQFHSDAGGIRSGPLPSAAIDGSGIVWVVWEDCRFRSSCSTNDLVYSTSSDGATWSSVTRIPIDDVSTTVDHFIPGIGIDPATSGSTAHIAMHYYYYSQSSCVTATCQLFVGYISSSNGGSTWNTPVSLAGPMLLSWLPNSQNGLMVGDYIATGFTNGVPHGVFAVAQAKSGTTFNESIYTAQSLTVKASSRQLSAFSDKPLHNLTDKIESEVPEKGIRPPLRRKQRLRVK